MLELLGNADVNIQMITTFEIKISVVIHGARVDQGANLVHAVSDSARRNRRP